MARIVSGALQAFLSVREAIHDRGVCAMGGVVRSVLGFAVMIESCVPSPCTAAEGGS